MNRIRGFTLVEIIVVMVLMGILASSFLVFFKPVIDSFIDAQRRADMTDAADTALRKMAQDIRRSVPNSLNLIDNTTSDADKRACFQLVPTIGGGRYRTDVDTADATAVALNDSSTSPYGMSTLASQGTPPVLGDFVVINNQNGDDVYDAGLSRARITALGSPLTLDANPAASSYVGGRFQLVSNLETSVMYTCANNKLTRKTLSDFQKKSACETDGDLVAGNVSECTFTDDGEVGVIYGLLTMKLVLTQPDSGESVSLGYTIHVYNAP